MKGLEPLIFTLGSAGLLLGTTAAALLWAKKSGQFHNLKEDAKSIFDADEGVGKVTDHFPLKHQSEYSPSRRSGTKA